MLVLTDTNSLRLDLDEFGEGVLKAPGNRDRAAQTDIEIREFAGGQGRCRIDRGAGLRNGCLAQPEFGMTALQIAHQAIGLARGGTVADRKQTDTVTGRQCGQGGDRSVPVASRFVRIDGGGIEELAGRIDHRDLHAGANAGIQPHDRLMSGRGTEQEILEIRGKDANRLSLGGFAQP